MSASSNPAVVLNSNARLVTPKLRKQLLTLLPAEDLYFSRTPEEARANAQRIIARGHRVVFSGGGDGTFVGLINNLRDAIAERNGTARAGDLPAMGLLKLGTGNGLSYDFGIQAGLDVLARVASGETLPMRSLSLVAYGDKLTTFAGTGWDAAIVNHFADWKRTLRSRVLQRWAGGLLGYFFSTFTRTIPTEWRLQGKVQAEVVNREAVTYTHPLTGAACHHAEGDVLYKGPVSIAGISTTPYYGFGMKAYPIAGLVPGMANLRIVAASIPETVGNLRKIWDGSYTSPRFHDWLVTSADIRFNMARPFHLGGDAAGYHESVSFTVSPFTVNMIDLSGRSETVQV